jgi:hypothetical protein
MRAAAMSAGRGRSFTIVERAGGWFWCSDAAWDTRGADALIGPFPLRAEAEKDAREALGMKDEE